MSEKIIFSESGYTITESRLIAKNTTIPMKNIVSFSGNEFKSWFLVLLISAFIGYPLLLAKISTFLGLILIIIFIISTLIVAITSIYLIFNNKAKFGFFTVRVRTVKSTDNIDIQLYKRESFNKFKDALEEAIKLN